MRTHITGSGVSILIHGIVLLSLLLLPLLAGGEETANPSGIVFRCDFESKTWWQEWDRSEPPKRTATVAADTQLKFEPHDGKALRIRVDQGGHYGVSLDSCSQKSQPSCNFFENHWLLERSVSSLS